MSKKREDELTEELTAAYSSLSRMSTSDSSNRRAAKRNYEARRRLENAIRRHTLGTCTCADPMDCLFALARLVPLYPRPKYGQKKKKVENAG